MGVMDFGAEFAVVFEDEDFGVFGSDYDAVV